MWFLVDIYPTMTCPITSPTSKALDTRVLTVLVYSWGYSFLRITLVIVLYGQVLISP